MISIGTEALVITKGKEYCSRTDAQARVINGWDEGQKQNRGSGSGVKDGTKDRSMDQRLRL